MSRHRIAVLIGDQAFNAARMVPWSGEVAVPAAQPGQPAALLQRRPDLLALQAQLDAANARRRQAKAEYFPRLFLGALFGGQNVELNSFDAGTTRFSLAAGLLAMPVFNAGRTRAINDIAESGQSEALLRYEDGIVRALEDVENALVALRDERQRAESLQTAAAAAEAALGRAQSLYNRGQIDLLPLLDAQRTRLTRADQLERQQHATAARQRAAVQGAGRRMAGVRACRPAGRSQRRHFATLLTSIARQRNRRETIFRRGPSRRTDRRNAVRLLARQAARRGAAARAHRRAAL